MNTKQNLKPSAILGVGTDIIEINRFESAMKKYGQKFLDKLFSKKEQEYCLRYNEPGRRFAARFSAKEAVVKALGEGFGKHVSFLDIEILNQENGRPLITLSDPCAKHFDHPTFFLSISHSKEYATAMVVATKML